LDLKNKTCCDLNISDLPFFIKGMSEFITNLGDTDRFIDESLACGEQQECGWSLNKDAFVFPGVGVGWLVPMWGRVENVFVRGQVSRV
jgi:hypothetical protein